MKNTNYKELGAKMRFYLYGEGVTGQGPDRFDAQITSDLSKLEDETTQNMYHQLVKEFGSDIESIEIGISTYRITANLAAHIRNIHSKKTAV